MTEEQLEDWLSEPYPEDIQAASDWTGNLVLVGAAGKMGPSLARRAVRAAGRRTRVIAVSRFSDPKSRRQMEDWGIETVPVDLMAPDAGEKLPDASHVVYLAARKFGTGAESATTWATNAYLPGVVAQRYRESRIVAFSTGNVYAFTPVESGGPVEETPLGPVGEYAQSALARERVFEHFSRLYGTRMTLLRLNYAVEPRYGVLADLAGKILRGEEIDVTMGFVNILWQGDANSICLRSFAIGATPPAVLNLTGTETLSVRSLAEALGKRMGREPVIVGSEAPTALLSNAKRCAERFGPARVTLDRLLDVVATWAAEGGRSLGKPTHFEVRDGKF